MLGLKVCATVAGLVEALSIKQVMWNKAQALVQTEEQLIHFSSSMLTLWEDRRELPMALHPEAGKAPSKSTVFIMSCHLPYVQLFGVYLNLLAQSQFLSSFLSVRYLCFWDRVSLCSHGCPRTYSVDQAGFELTEICLPLLPECWD